jgi:hypothetical protein
MATERLRVPSRLAALTCQRTHESSTAAGSKKAEGPQPPTLRRNAAVRCTQAGLSSRTAAARQAPRSNMPVAPAGATAVSRRSAPPPGPPGLKSAAALAPFNGPCGVTLPVPAWAWGRGVAWPQAAFAGPDARYRLLARHLAESGLPLRRPWCPAPELCRPGAARPSATVRPSVDSESVPRPPDLTWAAGRWLLAAGARESSLRETRLEFSGRRPAGGTGVVCVCVCVCV